MALSAGCRETDPPQAYNRDLGTDGTALLPTSSVFYRTDLSDGKADWKPFREPGDRPPVPANPATASSSTKSPAKAGASTADHDKVAAEIRAIIDEYNEVAADPEAGTDDLLEYYLEEQREMLRPFFDAALGFTTICHELRSELESRKPDAHERIVAAIEVLLGQTKFNLIVGEITVVSSAEASITVSGGALAPSYGMMVIDEEWYLMVPRASQLQLVTPALDQAMKTYRSWLTALRAGEASANVILQRLETAANTGKALKAQGG